MIRLWLYLVLTWQFKVLKRVFRTRNLYLLTGILSFVVAIAFLNSESITPTVKIVLSIVTYVAGLSLILLYGTVKNLDIKIMYLMAICGMAVNGGLVWLVYQLIRALIPF